MEKDNKYYGLIENLVRNHKKFPGYEPILDEIIDDVYAHSEVIIGSINNEKVINAYLEKVISTSIITVPKKLRFIPEIQYRRPSSERLIKPDVKTEYVDNLINSSFETKPEEEEEETLLKEIVVEEEPAAEIKEPIMVEEPIEEVIEEPEVTLELEPEPEEEIQEIPEVLEVKEEEKEEETEEFISTDFTDLSAFEPVSSLEEEPLPEEDELLPEPEPETELEIEIPEIEEEQDAVLELTEEEPELTIQEEEIEEVEEIEEPEAEEAEEAEKDEFSLEEFTLEEEPLEEEPAISLDLEEEETVEVLEEAPEEEPVEESDSSFSPTDYSLFATRLNAEDEEEDLTLDAEELASEISSLDSKRPELNIIKVYNLKYKENASVPQIAEQLEMSESSVLEALSEIIALV